MPPNHTEQRFLNSIRDFIHETNMLSSGDRVLTGVSGGADSMALLHTLIWLSGEFELSVGVAHLDHSLRGEESSRDYLFVENTARQLGIDFFGKKLDVLQFSRDNKLSLEEAGRIIRYDFLFNTAAKNGFNKIATGHHADDNAELVLMNMIRGSGRSGFTGIRPVSRNGALIRPLLNTTKSDIEEFMSHQRSGFITDTSNWDTDFLRNKIRLSLLPVLKSEYNGNIHEALNRTATITRDEELWLEDVIRPLYDSCIESEEKGTVVLLANTFNTLPVAARRRILRKAVKTVKGDLQSITLAHTDQACKLSQAGGGARSIDLPGRIRIQKDGSHLIVRREKESLRKVPVNGHSPVNFIYHVQKPGQNPVSVPIPEAGMEMIFSRLTANDVTDLSQDVKTCIYLDINQLNFPLLIRNVKPGDRFRPFGMAGRQKLKKFFSNTHVGLKERHCCPLLLSGNVIIWVAGHRRSDLYKINKDTEKILKVELLLA